VRWERAFPIEDGSGAAQADFWHFIGSSPRLTISRVTLAARGVLGPDGNRMEIVRRLAVATRFQPDLLKTARLPDLSAPNSTTETRNEILPSIG
jgi:hypothetical protein